MKNVQIRSSFWSKYRKIRTRKNSVFGHFSRSEQLHIQWCILNKRDLTNLARFYEINNNAYSNSHQMAKLCQSLFPSKIVFHRSQNISLSSNILGTPTFFPIKLSNFQPTKKGHKPTNGRIHTMTWCNPVSHVHFN